MKTKPSKRIPTCSLCHQKGHSKNACANKPLDLSDFGRYYYGVSYDYDTHTDCKRHGCDYICRCSEMVDFKIKSIDIDDLVNSIVSHIKSNHKNYVISKIDAYFIDRILRHFKLYNTDCWTPNICRGYYGEELNGFNILNIDKVQTEISKLLSFSDLKEKVEYILTLEYGYLLDELKNCDWRVEYICKGQIKLGNEHWYKKAADSNPYTDNNLPYIIGVVKSVKDTDSYRLFDGYHRFSACPDTKINILVASEKQ